MFVLMLIILFLLLTLFVIYPFFVGAMEGRREHLSNRTNSAILKPKSRSIAVILAAVFGPFAWLYVFEKNNQWKFWLNLVLCVITIFCWSAVAWIWAIIDLSVKPISYYENYGAKAK